jgi:hypothetical protein
MNGDAGVVEKFENDRYTVRMDCDGSAKTVSEGNLKPAKDPKWTTAYAKWLDGVSEELSGAVGAAVEVGAVLVPGFVFPKTAKEKKPEWQLPLKYLLLLSMIVVLAPLVLFSAPVAQVLSFAGFACSACILFGSLRRLVKLAVLTSILLMNLWLALSTKV